MARRRGVVINMNGISKRGKTSENFRLCGRYHQRAWVQTQSMYQNAVILEKVLARCTHYESVVLIPTL